MSAWVGYLAVRDIDDDVPPVSCVALTYHTIDGVAHAEGETYDITTNVGTLSTLVACQFADVTGTPPEPTPVAVPDVLGLTEAAATTAITSAGFVVGAVTSGDDGAAASGTVISQTPVGGTLAAPGSAIDLVVKP